MFIHWDNLQTVSNPDIAYNSASLTKSAVLFPPIVKFTEVHGEGL
jgi:hypothetical protein